MSDNCTNIDQEKQISAACQRITSDYAALQRVVFLAAPTAPSATTEAQ
jgi:hypothetical protein